jgi:YVTN family beta-propeller protein
VYATVQDSNQLVAIDLERHVPRWTVATGRQPAGAWMTPATPPCSSGSRAPMRWPCTIRRPAQGTKRLVTGKGAHNFLAVGDGRRMLLSNRVGNTVSVIDQVELKVVDTIPVPGGPDCMELRRDGKELWVTSRWINRVSVVDMTTKRLLHSIPVGRSPHGIYFPTHAARR